MRLPLSRLHAYYVHVRRTISLRHAINGKARLVILRYHSIGDEAFVTRYVNPDLALSPERFREHVQLLVGRFPIISPDDIPDVLAQRSRQPAVLITFDDGYVDNYRFATPILVEAGARATFYVATDPLLPGRWLWTSELWRLVQHLPAGTLQLPRADQNSWTIPENLAGRRAVLRRLTVFCRGLRAEEREEVLNFLSASAKTARGEGLEESFLSPSQLREMRRVGMTIGAHTRTHPHLDVVPSDEFSPELSGSRADLEGLLGEPIRHFAYPNPGSGGVVPPAVRQAVCDSGFQSAVTSISGRIEPDADLLRLPRLGVYRGASEALLFETLARSTF